MRDFEKPTRTIVLDDLRAANALLMIERHKLPLLWGALTLLQMPKTYPNFIAALRASVQEE